MSSEESDSDDIEAAPADCCWAFPSRSPPLGESRKMFESFWFDFSLIAISLEIVGL
jgi:hypothetical protein